MMQESPRIMVSHSKLADGGEKKSVITAYHFFTDTLSTAFSSYFSLLTLGC